jgi:hypothetical protein
MTSKSEIYRETSAVFRARAERATDAAVRTVSTTMAECYAGLARHQEWLTKYRRDLERLKNGHGPLPINMVDRLPSETVPR